MNRCPQREALLTLEQFENGTPRDLIASLRDQRILWEPDDFTERGHWLLFDQQDIDHVLKTPELFTNNFGPLLEDMPPEILEEQQQSLTFMDPPVHKQYRALVDYAFRPRALEARIPAMRNEARSIIDAVIDHGECEFVSEIAQVLPLRVMSSLMGIAEGDAQYVMELSNTMILADDPDFAEDRMAGYLASIELIEFGARLAADHRDHPRDSMTMEVLDAQFEGRGLTDREFGRFFNNLIVGGVETTRNTLSWCIYELIRNPDQYAMLEQDLALVPDAIEEILRLRNTVVYLRRTATRDMEFAGENIRKGDKLICVLGSVNHDPELFRDPEQFDITRPRREGVRRHYRTFGAGPHFCVGVHQARMNLVVMLEEIVRRMGDLRVLSGPVHAHSIFMDGFKELRIGFTARSLAHQAV